MSSPLTDWPGLGQLLVQRQQRLALVEASCGGALSAQATAAPGASAWFAGSLIPYADSTKQAWLAIDPQRIIEHGAVSVEVALDLAKQASRWADWAVAETGIYGPGGARPGKPVGTVCVAVQGPEGWSDAQRWQLSGSREQMRRHISDKVVAWLRAQLLSQASR
nr:CinA family protein [Oceanococcus sp. HetDA_MAG_MS8]